MTTISRSEAIQHIEEIATLIDEKNWRGLERRAFLQDEEDLEEQVKQSREDIISMQEILGKGMEKWTNEMLSRVLALPMFRYDYWYEDVVIVDDESEEQ